MDQPSDKLQITVPEPFDPANLRRLEFDKVKEIFRSFAATQPGKTLIDEVRPISDASEIQRLLDEAGEMMVIVYRGESVPLSGIMDVRQSLKRARVVDSTLPAEELKNIESVLSASRALRKFFFGLKSDVPVRGDFPLLQGWARGLVAFPDLEADISRSIGPDMSILDSASAELRRLRREIELMHGRIQTRMEQYVSSPSVKTLLQEEFTSERNGRPVVLVRAECRRQVPGIVHDTSRSGGAVYIEPMPVVELTNQQEEMRGQERAEIQRILLSLTAEVRTHANAIEQTAAVIAYFDFLNAKAQCARLFRMQVPRVGTRGVMHLRQARHPLLMASYERLHTTARLGTVGAGHCPRPEVGKGGALPLQSEVDSAGVVPIDVHLGENFDMLVITGPNTGGKTVALKTVGLLSLMAQSGLPITAKGTSEMPVFDGIYADVGDEQSIEQNLSTFSSHITHIAQVLKAATERSLVLLDELGAGTDPEEGAALGRSIMETLHHRRTRVIVTTHLMSLKEFAYATRRVENASVEFDAATLRPTFRLLIGVPGASSALVIAGRCGIPEQILRRAEQVLGDHHFKVEELIEKMKESHKELAEKMQQAGPEVQPPPAAHAAPVDTWAVLSTLKPGDPVYVRGWDVMGKALGIDKKRKRVEVELGRMRMEVDADDIFLVLRKDE